MIQNDAGEEWVFQGDNTRDKVCKWLFSKEHEGWLYDGYFIQQYLHENLVIPEVIMRGAKILMMYVPMLKIKFIDSLSFIPMRLADFPKTFGLNELAKGYFPHLFDRTENQNYVGSLPPSPFSNGMRWHDDLKENNYMFNFQEEISSYRRLDVDILRRCCLEFHKLFCDVTDIDPFEKCLRIRG